jgi:hypothetical protein
MLQRMSLLLAFPVDARDSSVIEHAIAAVASGPNGGLFIAPSTQALAHRDLIVGLARRHEVTGIHFVRPFDFLTVSKSGRTFVQPLGELAKFEASDDEAPLRGSRISYFDFFLVPFFFFVAMTLFLGVWRYFGRVVQVAG